MAVKLGKKWLLISLGLNGLFLYGKFWFSILAFIAILPTLVLFFVLAIRGMVLFARSHSVSDLVPRLFPIVVFVGIAAISPYYTSYIEYKIRSEDLARDVAHEKAKDGVGLIRLDKWSNGWDNFDLFIYSDKFLPEGYYTKDTLSNCPGDLMRIKGNYYVFFANCEPLF